jgi:hypothetical protein
MTYPESLKICPEGPGRGRLWSLWDMFNINAGNFIGAHSRICSLAQILTDRAYENLKAGKSTWPVFSDSNVGQILDDCRTMSEIGGQLDLSGTAACAVQLITLVMSLPPDPSGHGFVAQLDTFIRLNGAATQLRDVCGAETINKWFLGLDTRGHMLWRQPNPVFPQAVFDAFPSAQEDIEESAKCLAVDRATACVMHLMRAMEVPLKALANSLTIGQQNDWGAYIREIGKELESRLKAAGKRTSDE